MQISCPIFSTPGVQFKNAFGTGAAQDSPQVVGPLLSCDLLRRREAKSMPPMLASPRSPNRGELFLERVLESLMARISSSEAAPISWLHVLGLIVVLWAVSSDSIAQARDLVVTEVRGTAVRSNSSAVRTLETLKVGERVRLSSDSRVCLFADQDANLYEIDGPAEVLLSPKGVLANGKPVEGRKLADAYRNVKVNGSELVQGSMVMRSAGGARLRGPEGVVSEDAARTFSWTAAAPVRFELTTQSGDLVYRSSARGTGLELPADVRLARGQRYAWGIFAEGNGTAPLDWTEFTVAGDAESNGPAVPTTATERVLYAGWLNSKGLERAASRMLQPVRD